jgi:ATP-binding cassette subfamily F protein 3
VNLLLLDEPTNHLDMDACDSLLAAIDAFEGAAVIVTHNEMFLHSLATRFVVFDRGRARVFDGSYQDFLDTVGWEDDENEMGEAPTSARRSNAVGHGAAPATAHKPAAAPAEKKSATRPSASPAIDKKEDRQARARRVQERAKRVGPLEKRVAELEALIVSLERERDITFAALAEASAQGDAASITRLSKKSGEVGPRIDWAYTELEKVSAEFDRAVKEFEEQTRDTP